MTINDEERGPLLHGNGSAQNKDAVGEDDASVRDGASIPVKTWQSEYRLILIYSIPLVATYLLQYSAQLIAVVSSARLSTDELAGVSLGITTSNIIGYAVRTLLYFGCFRAYFPADIRRHGHGSRHVMFASIWCWQPLYGWAAYCPLHHPRSASGNPYRCSLDLLSSNSWRSGTL